MDELKKNTEILEELRKAGVITDQEYETKIAQLAEPQGASAHEEPPSFQPINYEELRKLEDILHEGLINKTDYQKKAAQMIGISSDASAIPPRSTGLIGWIKSNVAASLVIAALAVALAIVGSMYAGLQNEVNTLNTTIKSKDDIISSLERQKKDLEGYKTAVSDFYLDSAVMVIEGDNKHYHRYNCPSFPDEYRYLLYNIDAAVDQGYSKCPTCYDYTAYDYCVKFFED